MPSRVYFSTSSLSLSLSLSLYHSPSTQSKPSALTRPSHYKTCSTRVIETHRLVRKTSESTRSKTLTLTESDRVTTYPLRVSSRKPQTRPSHHRTRSLAQKNQNTTNKKKKKKSIKLTGDTRVGSSGHKTPNEDDVGSS